MIVLQERYRKVMGLPEKGETGHQELSAITLSHLHDI